MLGELVEGRVSVRWHALELIQVSAAIREAKPDDPALAHVYVDLREAPLLIYIGDRGHVRVLIRRVELPAGFDEAAREEVGAIVSSAIDALCAGGTIGVVRDAPQAAAPVAAPIELVPVVAAVKPAAAAPQRWSGGVLLRYRVMGWAPRRVQQMLELGAQVRRHLGRVDPRAGLWAGTIVPTAVTSGPDPQRVGGATLRAELGAAVVLAPRWSQLLALGGGVDLLRGTGGRWAAVPMLQASLGTRVALGRGVVLELHGHADVDLVDTRLLGRDGRLLLDPWRVRPGISLTLGWTSGR